MQFNFWSNGKIIAENNSGILICRSDISDYSSLYQKDETPTPKSNISLALALCFANALVDIFTDTLLEKFKCLFNDKQKIKEYFVYFFTVVNKEGKGIVGEPHFFNRFLEFQYVYVEDKIFSFTQNSTLFQKADASSKDEVKSDSQLFANPHKTSDSLNEYIKYYYNTLCNNTNIGDVAFLIELTETNSESSLPKWINISLFLDKDGSIKILFFDSCVGIFVFNVFENFFPFLVEFLTKEASKNEIFDLQLNVQTYFKNRISPSELFLNFNTKNKFEPSHNECAEISASTKNFLNLSSDITKTRQKLLRAHSAIFYA